MKKISEKRTGCRENIKQEVGFILSEIESGRIRNITEKASVVDISSGGIGLRTSYPLKEGSVLRLYFPVTAGDARLPVFTEVMWVRPDREFYNAGMRFLV